jgi:hypothetical protein
MKFFDSLENNLSVICYVVLAGEADIYVLHILNLSKNLMYLYAILYIESYVGYLI